MTDLLTPAGFVLGGSGYAARRINPSPAPGLIEALVFENSTVIGFVMAFGDIRELLDTWRERSAALLRTQVTLLAAAGPKAWNTYLVLLAPGEAGFAESLALGQIEEDLGGTRKIARAGVGGLDATRSALLPLLPFRTAPVLDPVDMAVEIRERTTELPNEVVGAFLLPAEGGVVLQVAEDVA